MNETPAEMLSAYVRAFETLEPSAVTPFYLLPCTFVRPDGVWVVADVATATTLAAHLIDHARSQGYRRTETVGLDVRQLAAELALLTGTFVRYDDVGAVLGRFGFTYVARRQDGAWRIVVAVAHDPVVPGDARGAA